MSGLTLTAFRQLTLFRTNLLRSKAVSSSLVPVQSCQATSSTSKMGGISLQISSDSDFSKYVVHLVAVVVEHLEAEEHVTDSRRVGLDARGTSHRVKVVGHWVAVVFQVSYNLA